MLVVAAGGCGGEDDGEARRVAGTGYSFSAPAGWEVVRSGRTVTASDDDAAVSVTTFALDRPYRPDLWPSARTELDRVTDRLAAQLGARVATRADERLAGRRGRVYRLSDARDGTRRIAFVLVGRREYQLLCRGDRDDVCDRLLASFRLTR